ncbi:MAG: hypothetical protein IPQ13_08270 [Holophagaceae bacterium]|nr:hypothetical protein [Holophagaceae bacterium]
MTATYFSGNTAPIITSTSIPGVPQNHGIPVNSGVPPYQFSASDTAGDPLTWSLVSAPAGFSLTSGGVLTWSSNFATGSDFAVRTITVKVTDAGGLSDTKTLQINIVSDTKPNFTTQTYTETVTNVQFHDPSNLRQKITGYSFFNFLDTNAADREYYADPSSSIKGWRAGVTATDAENDVVVYSVKTNSVFRFGSPYVATTDSNASPAGGRYPYVVPGPAADTSGTGVVRNPGEIVWRPGRNLGNPGTNGAVLNTGINTDALTGSVDGTPTHDPANWSFTVVAQQLIGTTATPGQFNETTLTIKVQPNHQPSIGALTTINVPTITAGVNTGAGTAVVPNVGRPAIQEPVASDTSTPGTPSKWIWTIGTPGTAGADTVIADPNTNGFHGHQDAIQVFFGSAPFNTANGIGVLSATAGNYPTFDTTGNYPAVDTTGTIPNGFYNPWLGAVPSPATYTVAWAPIRIQYQLGRYLACAYGITNGYNFPLKVEDQYTLSSTNEVSIFPIFGTVKLFNSRFRFLEDDGTDGYELPRGNFTAAGNYRTTSGAYTFAYLPIGVSAGAGNAEILAAGVSTYGSKLFGQANSPVGSPASGYGTAAGGYTAPNTGGPTAGNWHTLDAVNTGAFFPLSTGNPLNPLFNPAANAAAVPGTLAGATLTYTQFTGSSTAPTGVSVTVSGPYANNEADARKIPSNSPYHFSLVQTTIPYGGAGNDGFTAPRYYDLPNQPVYGPVQTLPREQSYGCAQSEVNVQAVLPGRPAYMSAYSSGAFGVDGFANSVVLGSMLRLSFTWPTLVTNTAGSFPAAGTANTWGTTDVMQVATPNIGGRGRFFFTGNYVGASETDPLNFWKVGFASATGLTTTTGFSQGVDSALSQPIHVPTDSLWVPAATNGHFNLLNTFSTPAGGSGYTDIPFAGVHGYLQGGFIIPTMSALADTPIWAQMPTWNMSAFVMGPWAWFWGNVTNTGYDPDRWMNPARIDTATGDRAFFLWMKQEAPDVDAYGTFAGSYLNADGSTGTLAVGGHTTATAFTMGSTGLTDTQSQISFSEIGTQLGGVNQAINSGISMTGWAITQFEQLRSLVAAPAQYGQAPRARLVDPAMVPTGSDNTVATFDNATIGTFDGITSNSLIVYAVRNRGILGEAGIEASSPVLAQWWNTGHADIDTASFPGVMTNYTSSFLPAGEFTEVVELKHNFIGKLAAPDATTTEVQKVILSTGIIAPNGNSLLTNAIPVVTPVRQLAINDLKINTATGTTSVGTKLDIFNGTAELSANGATYGVPAGGIPSYKLFNGNALPASDYRLHGNSTLQLTFQPAVNDLRQPSGYEVTLYSVYAFGGPSVAVPVHVIRMGHRGGIGAIQTLNFPNLWDWTPDFGIQPYAIKVRNIWMDGTEGAAGHSFDMAKEPNASRFPMAWADCLSGVFVVDFTSATPIAPPQGVMGTELPSPFQKGMRPASPGKGPASVRNSASN